MTSRAVSSSIPRFRSRWRWPKARSTGCTIPSPIPPSSVSGIEDSRPTRAAASAWTVKMTSVVVSSLPRNGVMSTPARPEIAPLIPQATRLTRLTLMPSSRAASGASLTALVAVPRAVDRKNTARSPTSPAVIAMTVIWPQLMVSRSVVMGTPLGSTCAGCSAPSWVP